MNSAELVARAVACRKEDELPGGTTISTIFEGDGWRAMDIICSCNAADPAFEEQHDYVSVALLMAGTFSYRSLAGKAHLVPGSILLGSAATCFSCGHEHGEGDRCIAFQFSPGSYDEILVSIGAGSLGSKFPRVSLPAAKRSVSLFVDAEMLAGGSAAIDAEDLALRLVGFTAASLEVRAADAEPKPAQTRTITAITRFIESDLSLDHRLEALARLANMSRFHFLRCFKRVVGMTPHAFVRTARLREAARLLRDPTLSVTEIAFEVGFQDLSVFNEAFRQVFDLTPSQLRARQRQAN